MAIISGVDQENALVPQWYLHVNISSVRKISACPLRQMPLSILRVEEVFDRS